MGSDDQWPREAETFHEDSFQVGQVGVCRLGQDTAFMGLTRDDK